jgi:hypothetical protein
MNRKALVVSIAAAAVLILGGLASAQMWNGHGGGPGYGMGPGMMYSTGSGTAATINVEKFKQFQKETAGMRDEMVLKRVELRNEYAKDKPDVDRVASLKKEIIDLQTKITKAADKAGIDDLGIGRHGYGGYGMMRGYGQGQGFCDHGQGGMRGSYGPCAGYGYGPCGAYGSEK